MQPPLLVKAAVYCCGSMWFIDKPHTIKQAHPPERLLKTCYGAIVVCQVIVYVKATVQPSSVIYIEFKCCTKCKCKGEANMIAHYRRNEWRRMHSIHTQTHTHTVCKTKHGLSKPTGEKMHMEIKYFKPAFIILLS